MMKKSSSWIFTLIGCSSTKLRNYRYNNRSYAAIPLFRTVNFTVRHVMLVTDITNAETHLKNCVDSRNRYRDLQKSQILLIHRGSASADILPWKSFLGLE